MKLTDRIKNMNFSFLSSVIAIVIGLLFGLVILLISNPAQAMGGFSTILTGAFRDMRSIGRVMYFATPIILTGLSVGFAFKTGLFNIGASGQFILGAFGAVIVGIKLPQLGSVHWVVALLAAAILGGLWALLPGILKAYANVHEVISSIMMNYIGMYLVNYLVLNTVYDRLRNQSMGVAKSAVIPKMGLDRIFPRSNVNAGFFIAILAVIVIYIILNRTSFGFELKAVGYNRDASKYAGINEKRSIILSMVIAGALAGLGGGLLYLAGTGKYIEVVDILAAEGFTGISVALLGLSNPIGILFAGLFIGYITVGGDYMQLYDFAPEIIDIIVASIIYFSAFSLIVKNVIDRRRMKLGGGKVQ
ncbi:MAG: ABC transporter permease [Eubacteriales bacterium]|nr:ABC transporter permease [Eubacteriales bacterium]MDD4078567.1 ABC transporter permease [Eubacteriales bacterium]MDD4768820.1 ABC transporter permease [Eubacteriales bacterium]